MTKIVGYGDIASQCRLTASAEEETVRLTTRGRYAVTSMLDLALHEGQGPIALASISERQDISLSYLEQLFSHLRRNELVTSVRGPGGGYLLSRSPDQTSIADVIEAVSEDTDTTRCKGLADCQNGHTCLTHHLWTSLNDEIRDFLEAISLADLVARNEIQDIARQQEGRQHELQQQALTVR